MRRAAASITLLLALLAAAPAAHAGGLDLRVGAFLPRQRDCGVPSSVPAEYTLFQDVCELYAASEIFKRPPSTAAYSAVSSTTTSSLKNVELGRPLRLLLEDHRHLLPRLRAAADLGGGNIYQTLRLQTWPLGMSLRFIPTGKKHQVRALRRRRHRRGLLPLRGVRRLHRLLRPGPRIISDHFIDDGTAFGVHALGGFRYYVNRDFAIVGEAKYLWAGTTTWTTTSRRTAPVS